MQNAVFCRRAAACIGRPTPGLDSVFALPRRRFWSAAYVRQLPMIELSVTQICRKIRGSGSVRSSNQTASGASKNSFTIHFWHKSFILDDAKRAELSNKQFWTKECDILAGIKIYSDPPTYFQGSRPPTPGSTPPDTDFNFNYNFM